MKTPAKILLIDIETAPSLGWVWQKYDTTVIDFKSDWYVLSYAFKWLHEKKIQVKCLADYTGYKAGSEDDRALIDDIWKLLDEADIVIGHNGNSFDIPKINTRFLTHRLPPTSPYKTVDTLKVARKIFAFDSNKLDDLGRYLKVGRKLPHTGFHLWRSCMAGDAKAWGMIKRYNARDIDLLEKVYYLMREWAPTSMHPNVNKGQIENCPKCGSSKVQRRGFSYTMLRQKQRYQCLACRSWHEGSAKRV